MHGLTLLLVAVVTSHDEVAKAVAGIAGLLLANLGSILHKLSAPQYVKGAVTFILAAVIGIVTSVIWTPDEPWWQWALACMSALVGQVVAHSTGVTDPVAKATADWGIGAERG